MRIGTLQTACVALAINLLPGPSWAQDCTPDARRVVDAIYRQVLERGANGEGGAAINQLTTGQTTVRELVRNVAKSQEHMRRFMSGARATDVTFAYRHLLGREPDPEGLASHERILQTESPSAVVDNMIDSAEYQQQFSADVVPGARLRYCGPQSVRTRFLNMDGNGNGVIERAEWTGGAAAFGMNDWNRDGVLSGEEVRVGGRRAARDRAEDDFDPSGPPIWTTRNFRLLDRNNDSRVSAVEWYYSPEYFRRADRNRDGALSADEFTGGAWDDDRDNRFENLDVNNNGRIEAKEWAGSADAFQWLDRNRDNWLSRAEVVGESTGSNSSTFDSFRSLDFNRNNSLESNEWRWSQRSFDRYDANRDGRLTRQEFTSGRGVPSTQ